MIVLCKRREGKPNNTINKPPALGSNSARPGTPKTDSVTGQTAGEVDSRWTEVDAGRCGSPRILVFNAPRLL